MKKVLFLFFALSMCLWVSAQKPEAVATKATGMPLAIDGVLDEAIWATATKYQIEKPYNGESFDGPADCSGFFQAAWSEKGVYVAVTVTDDITQNDQAFGPNWAQDMVELYFDVNEVKEDGLGTRNGSGHLQNAEIVSDGFLKATGNSLTAYKMDGTNYVKEVFIAWSDVKNSDGNTFVPTTENSIGFDVYIVDNDADSVDSGRNYRNRLVWSNNGDIDEGYQNMDDAGILKFDSTSVDKPYVATSQMLTGAALTIDGKLDEAVWNGAVRYPVQKNFNNEGFSGDEDCSGYFQTLWTNKGIYVAVTVTDDITQNDGAFGPSWAQDMVELYFDVNDVKKDGVGTKDGKGHLQNAEIASDGFVKVSGNSITAYKMSGTNYVKEIFLSWSDIKKDDGTIFVPGPDATMGFDVYIVDNDADSVDSGQNYRNRLVWSNNGDINEGYNNMDDAGLLTFDNSVELFNPAVASASKVTGDTIVADGLLEESVWSEAPKYTIGQDYIGESFSGPSDCSAYFQSVWTSKGIYVAVTVTDDVTQNDESIGPNWAQDGVEIYFDVNAIKADSLGSRHGKGHYQNYGIVSDGFKEVSGSSVTAYAMKGTNYTKELYMSWEDLKNADGNPFAAGINAKIGFDIYVIDNDADEEDSGRNYRNRLVWSNIGTVNENYQLMDDAGTLSLAATSIENVYEYVEEPDAVNENQLNNNVVVYPNPAKDILYVKNISDQAIITILSADGKSLMKVQNTREINISSLQKGLYLVKIDDENQTTNKRILIK